MRAQSLQPCLNLYDPKDCSLPGSPVRGILQERILEWAAISPPGDLPEPGIEPKSPTAPVLQTDSLLLRYSGSCVATSCVCLAYTLFFFFLIPGYLANFAQRH